MMHILMNFCMLLYFTWKFSYFYNIAYNIL